MKKGLQAFAACTLLLLGLALYFDSHRHHEHIGQLLVLLALIWLAALLIIAVIRWIRRSKDSE